MKRLLYIGSEATHITQGSDVVNNRNVTILRRCFCNSFYLFPLNRINKVVTLVNMLLGYLGFLSPIRERKITQLIEKEDINIVFLSSSKMGKLAKVIKQQCPNVEIHVFFHNIEKQYMEEEVKNNSSLRLKITKYVCDRNEKLAITYGDRFIVLNKRDAKLLTTLYDKTADLILPTTFADSYDVVKANSIKNNDSNTLSMLFVGTAFFGNTEGLDWFIKNVMPRLKNVKLTIAGKGMDGVYKTSNNIKVCGYVPDLSALYYAADIVVLPILSGGGMKTKTAEAMMYGCPIMGTVEAFEGYDVDYTRIGARTRTTDEMVDFIELIQKDRSILSKASEYSRSVFEQKYSNASAQETIKNFLSEHKSI